MPFGTSKTYGFSNEIIPFLVISGTGNGVGVFVYNGTPEFGNPPIAWLTNGSLVDPFGNPLPSVMGIAGVGEFSAGVATITSTGLFLYTTGGQLAFSFSTVNGNDPRNSQPYDAGLWAYNSGGGGGVAFLTGNSPAVYFVPPDVATVAIQPQLQSFSDNAGLVNELVALSLFSGEETTGSANAAVQVFSEANDGSTVAQGNLITTGVKILNWSTNGIFVSTGNGELVGRPDFTLIDATTDTNANNGSQPMTMQWPIPADEPQVGSIYEIITEFSGNTGTASSGTLGFKPSLNGTVLTTSNGDTIGGTAWPAVNTGFTGEIKVIVKVKSIGNAGTADIFIKGGLSIQGNLQGSGNSDWFLSSQVTGHAFDTLLTNTIAIESVWGSSIAGQTITSDGSAFTRKGP
jgi:hypothetical protein